MSNCKIKRSLSCQIDRLLNIHKSAIKRLSRSKNLSGGRLSRPELPPISSPRGGRSSAVPGWRLSRQPRLSSPRGGRSSAVPGWRLSRQPRPKRAASNGKAVRAGAAWRWRSALCAGRRRHAAPDRTALPSGGGRWAGGAGAGDSGSAESRTRRRRTHRGAKGGERHGRPSPTDPPTGSIVPRETLYRISCCRGMFYNIKS